MRKYLIIILAICSQSVVAQHNPEGIWKGYLEFSGRKMDIVVVLEKSGEKWQGRLSSETQKLKDLVLTNILIENENVRFDVPLAGGSWAGTLTSSKALNGHWNQGLSVPLNFTRIKTEPVINAGKRKQTPEAPFPYHTEEVTYANKKDGTKLAATLTIPNGDGPFPAAILLTVAGANDRDQSFGSPAHKPYMVLADHLTRNGIAVLRADDRGVGGSQGDLFNSTIEDFAWDAVAGADFLRQQAQIDKKRIGFIGNSEGTLVGPLAASLDENISFIITLGGIGIEGSEIILDQADAIGKLSGFDQKRIGEIKTRTRKMFDILMSESDSLKIIEKLDKLLKAPKGSTADSRLFLLPQSKTEQLRIFSSPWYRYQIAYDPAPVLQQIRFPFLALHGSLDPFVLPDKNLAAISENLRTAGNPHYAAIKLENVNHIMQDAASGSPANYQSNEISFSPRALEIMTTWLKITLEMN